MSENSGASHNIKIYPIYKMFAWDLLFYYAIYFLFLTEAKGFSASKVLFIEAFLPVFKILTQIACTRFTLKTGKCESVILGNLAVSLSILVLILGNNIELVIFSNLLSAIGFNLKGLCETSLLYDSISPNHHHKRDIFSKIDGKALSKYYIVDAITSFAAGFLFVVNPYLPMVLCLLLCLTSTMISLSFKETEVITRERRKLKTSLSERKQNFKHAVSFIIKSNRLRSLLLFSGLFMGTLTVFKNLMNSLLIDLKIPDEFFGLIFVFIQIISSITSRKQSFFRKKLKNRTLSYFSLSLVSAMLITGLVVVCKINYNISLLFTFAMIAIYAIVKAPFFTLIKRYFNSFTTPEVNTKIYAAVAIIDSIFQAIFCLFTSFLLKHITTAYSLIIIGGILFIMFIILLEYMKTRVGLKPEEYDKSEIEYT